MNKTKKDSANNHPELQTAEDVEEFMRKHWIEHQSNSHPEDCMPFTEYISNCDFLLKDTGWYWDSESYIFLKI